ncbi:glycosyltransferase [Thaumasiovibrio sp. DFM-14]|uniref:glycosyltransferase n=1 Tax=Thaumasiovibrio sp. DFM-14 TaxID=3384792 RepID=UPI0039A106AC
MCKVAVAMSVYKSDKALFVKKAIDSILNQSCSNFDLFVEVDGPVSDEIKITLEGYDTLDNVYINFNEINKGLAYRLNSIIDRVLLCGKYTYLARMDADDISGECRLQKQVSFLESNQDISVVGSDVNEISDDGEFLFYKKMDAKHEALEKRIITKCPFNHPSVMFKIDVFTEGFRYNSNLKNTQDYYLWVDLLANEKKFANINEPLLDFRVSNGFHSRRGVNKALNDLKSRLYAFDKLNCYSIANIIHTIVLFMLRLSPPFVKKLAYKFLR